MIVLSIAAFAAQKKSTSNEKLIDLNKASSDKPVTQPVHIVS